MRRGSVPAVLLLLGLFLSVLLGLCLGGSSIGPLELVTALGTRDPADTAYQILVHIRLPRVWGAVLAGAGLAASGAVLQCVLENPLASPNIVGVNTGAGLGVLLVSAFFPTAPLLRPAAALLGALLTAGLVLGAAAACGFSRLTVILSGFALSTVLGAGMNLLLILYPDAYVGSGTFLAGGFSALRAAQLPLPTLGIAAGILLLLCFCRELNLLSLGSDGARSLGMHVTAWRGVLLGLAALLASLVVSYGGLIGFVGLAAPHIARLWVGADARLLLPVSILLGGFLVNTCDLLARILFAPYEVPVGILLSIAGGVFFLALLLCGRREWHA